MLKVREVTLKAVERARQGGGPSVIENKTYRIKGHFEGDPQRYRTDDEVRRWQDQKDPVRLFADFLTRQDLLTPKLDQHIRYEVAAQLQEALAFAEHSPFPEPHEAEEDLFVNAT